MKAALLLSLSSAIAAQATANPATNLAPISAGNRYAATIAPVERLDSGVLAVERYGATGRPLILIPGLASGAKTAYDASLLALRMCRCRQ